MILYRIIHKSIAYQIQQRPDAGALVVGKGAYILAFDSFAMAVLEHPFYKLVLGFPTCFYMTRYLLPDDSIKKVSSESAELYRENAIGNRQLGSWLEPFLVAQSELVAEFQSRDWSRQLNFVVNTQHPLFEQVEVEEMFAIR